VINAGVSNGAAVVTVDGTSPLSSVGSAVLVQSGIGNFLVAHTGTDSFAAFTTICTHEGCVVTGYESQQFVCPCHGSRYNTSGRVVQGPAPSALRQFATSFSDGVLLISA
jgi:Rieske Fe-S protein